jgi:hypothetical protein
MIMHMHEDLYQFLVCDYFATGEGRSIMLLITRAYPKQIDYEIQGKFEDGKYIPPKIKDGHTPKVIAAREFVDEFGGWYAQGVENVSRKEFIARYGHHLPEYIKKMLDDSEQPGNLHFTQKFHFNYS